MIEAPLSEDFDYSSEYLDEFHGRDNLFDSNDIDDDDNDLAYENNFYN